MSSIFKTKINIKYYIINQEKKILVLKKSEHSHNRPGVWDLPGGGLKHSDFTTYESNVLYHAGLREVEEECGIIIDEEKGILVHQYSTFEDNHTQKHELKLRLYYAIKLLYTPDIILSKEHNSYERCTREEYLGKDFGGAEERYHASLIYIKNLSLL